jgi:hypothetical protein
MNAIALILAIATVVSLGFLALFMVLLIGMRTEGSQLRPSSAPHTRLGSAARRVLGLYVQRQHMESPLQYADVRR